MKKNYYIFIRFFDLLSSECTADQAGKKQDRKSRYTGSNKTPGTGDTGNYVGYSALFQQL